MRSLGLLLAAAAAASALPTYTWDKEWQAAWGQEVTRITAAAVLGGQVHAVERGGTAPYSTTVFVLSPKNGSLVRTWGHGAIASAHGAKAANDGKHMFITDDGDFTIKLFDPSSGSVVSRWGVANKEGSSLDPLQFGNVADVATIPGDDSQFFVVDGDGGPNNRLLAVDAASGKVTWHVGGTAPSSAPGLFSVPHSVAYDSTRHALWVADRSNNRTQAFSASNGSFLFEQRCLGEGGQPWGIRVDEARGTILVADGTLGRLLVFDLAKGSIQPPCKPAQVIDIPPAASKLHEMAVDPSTGDVFIAMVGDPTGMVKIAVH